MTDFDIHEYGDIDEFTRGYPADITGNDIRLRWQLLGELDADEILVVLPEWLAEDKAGFVDGAVPTEFVGRIERETDDAILLANATAAKPLTRIAHRIHNLEDGLQNVTGDEDRREWLKRRLEAKRREFTDRDEMTGLQEEWLPKSQIIHAARRRN